MPGYNEFHPYKYFVTRKGRMVFRRLNFPWRPGTGNTCQTENYIKVRGFPFANARMHKYVLAETGSWANTQIHRKY